MWWVTCESDWKMENKLQSFTFGILIVGIFVALWKEEWILAAIMFVVQCLVNAWYVSTAWSIYVSQVKRKIRNTITVVSIVFMLVLCFVFLNWEELKSRGFINNS
ncbi:hypothetical protein SNE40_020681 [Patella caerulea]|uniref:Uncharacterized protein n=1 Tax=Patella caerulea TaxID=87958 RepID=A0AAN8J4U8_PATCE